MLHINLQEVQKFRQNRAKKHQKVLGFPLLSSLSENEIAIIFFIITQSFVSIWMAVCVCWCGNPVGKFRHMQRQQYSTLRLSSLISVVSYPSKLSLEQGKMSETCITQAQTQRYSLKRDFIRGIFITLK